MTVAVTNGLNYVSDGLRALGYVVVEYGSYKNRIDAVVYSGQYLESTEMTASNFAGTNGILMINATNKTVEQIDGYLKRKAYSGILD